MDKIKLKALTQEYSGRCKIIPCCDLPKMEDDFDGLKDDIADSFKRQQIICDWTLKDGVLEKYEDPEDGETDEDVKVLFWEDVVCSCLKDGFLVVYDVPVPRNVKKKDGKLKSWETSGWGYYQTLYIHLPDISQLSAVLSNLDDRILEDVYNEEQEQDNE